MDTVLFQENQCSFGLNECDTGERDNGNVEFKMSGGRKSMNEDTARDIPNEMDTIIGLSASKKNSSLAKNLKIPKYTDSYNNNDDTATKNYGIISNSTEVPLHDNNDRFIGINASTVIPIDKSRNSLVSCKNVTSNTCLPKTSTVRCNSVRSSNSRVVATSLTELKVDANCSDTRRASSEPGSLSTTTVIKGQRTHAINQPHEPAASHIASFDRLDSVDKVLITDGSSKSNLHSLITSPACSTISLLSKTKLSSNYNSNNATGEESDYVVDPVHGNAYHKGQFLGKGGFARVYLMTDITNEKRYACKIIPKNRIQKIHIQKIAREIMIHKDLNHINVVQMHHYFENSLNVYMLLEACPRKSLMHVLKYRGKVTEPEARYYMKQMVTGVAYIHSQKVVHRDLKPGNMFLSDGMIVKIGDFGLATRPDGQRKRVTICGTPNYIAPEVLYKQAYSYEADVWALGCILYALLAGQPPFDTATLKETYSRICNNRYKKLTDTVLTKNGQDLMKSLLQPIPELRPSLETVKDHPYLTTEFVPKKLAHSCCYRPPDIDTQEPINDKQLKIPVLSTSFPSATSLSSTSCTSTVSRRITHSQINERAPKNMTKYLETTIIPNGINTNLKLPNNINVRTLSNGLQKETEKKSKVENWLVRKFPKLTKLRRRIYNFLCPDRKKSSDSAFMHYALENCLSEIRHSRAIRNPSPIAGAVPLFVTKWIDYSNKYGLCFQLSDRSVGVLFNDSTKMSYTQDRRCVEYTNPDDEVTRYAREHDVPSSMQEKLELLRHFTEYMDDHLTNGGEIGEHRTIKLTRRSDTIPRMRRWLRTDKAIVMELTVPLLQVNFFSDHTKIVVSEGSRPRDYLVTYIDADRQATTYWLNDIRNHGCTLELYERLNYVCKASREFAHLENNVGCSEISINCKTSIQS